MSMPKSNGTRLTESWQPSEALKLKVTTKYTATPGQIIWMRDRFVNYFTGPDATRPVKKDWDRAFVNWCDTDAPKAKRTIKQEPSMQVATRQTDWRWVAATFKRTGKWYSTSPEPGYGGCECPREILEEFGLLKKKGAGPQVAAPAPDARNPQIVGQ